MRVLEYLNKKIGVRCVLIVLHSCLVAGASCLPCIAQQPAGDSGSVVLALQAPAEVPDLYATGTNNLALTKVLVLYGLLANSSCGKDTTNAAAGCPTYLIVNLVHWIPGANNGAGDAHAPESSWYLIHPESGRSTSLKDPVLDASLRIFGSKSIGLLVVHEGISAIAPMNVRYTIEAKAKKSVQESDALSLFNLVVGGVRALARNPADDYLVGARPITNISKLPADIAISGAAYPRTGSAEEQKAAATFTQTYDDEGFARWDVSIGIPVKGVSEVQYNSTDGTVQAKTVSKVNAYGLFHWYPYPVDLKSDYPWLPSVVGGLPLSGKPLNKPFVGLAIGTRKPFPFRVNVFAGVVFNKVFSPATLPTGSSASPGQLNNDLDSHRVRKLLVGIDIPIPQFIKAISKGSSGNSGN